MFNLAIECSAFQASVGLCYRDQMVIEQELPRQRGTLETLAPAIRDLVRGVSPSLISVTAGPGSFTGLRIGITTAKMLAFAWSIPVAPVDTLAAIAEEQRLRWQSPDARYRPMSRRRESVRRSESRHVPQLMELERQASGYSQGDQTVEKNSTIRNPARVVIAAIDAYRQQIFAAAWLWRPDGEWRPVAESRVVDAESWTEDPVRALDDPRLDESIREAEQIRISGPGLARYLPACEGNTGLGPRPPMRIAPEEEWRPKAAGVARLGWRLFREGQTLPADEVRPNYLRGSAAEEKARHR